jgi:signal transduction histidine kinase
LEPKTALTEFAPAERAADEEIRRQANRLLGSPLLIELLDAVPDILVVLNKERQIVYANRALLNFLGTTNETIINGLRPGEALNCIRATESVGGCGTSEFCKTCGAVRAILTGQQGERDVQECRITRKPDGEALDLQVWVTPVNLNSEQFTIFSAVDISDEKRRKALERIFFHDILNTAGSIQGFAEILREADRDELDEMTEIIQQLAEKMIEEIRAQRELLAAENNELVLNPAQENSLALLQEIVDIYKNHEVAKERYMAIDSHAQEVTFVTDRTLLRRVLGNMVKNGLEASKPNEQVTVGCDMSGNDIQFWVHNPTFMDREIQLQLFQRSFSTKGSGRGLGTYSMKLLSERYLKGKVSFTSSPEHGTTFKASYPLTLSIGH